MQNACRNLFVKTQVRLAGLKNEEGQDLIEYALVVALVALAATAGMNSLANGINAAFSQVANTLNSYM